MKNDGKDFKINCSKCIGMIFSIILSAVLGWYVNYYLSHSKPQLMIEKINFFYDFPDKNNSQFSEAMISFSDEIIKLRAGSFYTFPIYPQTPLLALKDLLGEDTRIQLEKDHTQIKQSLELFISLLSNKNISEDAIADCFLQMLEDTYLLEYLTLLDKLGKNKLKRLDTKKIIEEHYELDVGIELSPRHYILERYLRHENFNVTLYRHFLLDLSAYIIQKQFEELCEYLKKAHSFCDELRRIDMDIFNHILKITQDKINDYKKISIVIHVLNEGDFPIPITPRCQIKLTDSYHDKIFEFNSKIFEASQKNESESNSQIPTKSQEVYTSNVVVPKEDKIFIITSIEPLAKCAEHILALHQAKSLEVQVELLIGIKPHFQSRKVVSAWMRID
mgnify:CR=1 FL=1